MNWLYIEAVQRVAILVSTFLPQAEGTITHSTFMVSMALEYRILYMSCNLLLVPCHQQSRSHWSVAGVYPNLKLIVHCDSMPDASAGKKIFKALSDYIAKCRVLDKLDDDRDDWTFIPLHKYGLQRQPDAVNCGVFACVFAYSLVKLKDYTIKEEDIPLVRYWIGKAARVNYPDMGYSGSTIWKDTVIKPKKIRPSLPEPFGKGRLPFERLKSFMYEQMRLQDDSPISDAEVANANLRAIFDGRWPRTIGKIDYKDRTLKEVRVEFVQDSVNKAHHLLKDIRELHETKEYESERLKALCSLPLDDFKECARKELPEKILPVFGKVTEDVIFDLRTILRRRKSDDFADRHGYREYVYDIDRRFGLGFENFVLYVVFPELLTRFFMKNFSLNYREATGRLYGVNGPTNTVYHETIKVNEGH